MKKPTAINGVFLDIGGLLLTNGWDHPARTRAATNFKPGLAEMEEVMMKHMMRHVRMDEETGRRSLS